MPMRQCFPQIQNCQASAGLESHNELTQNKPAQPPQPSSRSESIEVFDRKECRGVSDSWTILTPRLQNNFSHSCPCAPQTTPRLPIIKIRLLLNSKLSYSSRTLPSHSLHTAYNAGTYNNLGSEGVQTNAGEAEAFVKNTILCGTRLDAGVFVEKQLMGQQFPEPIALPTSSRPGSRSQFLCHPPSHSSRSGSAETLDKKKHREEIKYRCRWRAK